MASTISSTIMLQPVQIHCLPSTECPICLRKYTSSHRPMRIEHSKCSHIFGKSCILRWLRDSNSCPMCRTILFDTQSPTPQALDPGMSQEAMLGHFFSEGRMYEIIDNTTARVIDMDIRNLDQPEQNNAFPDRSRENSFGEGDQRHGMEIHRSSLPWSFHLAANLYAHRVGSSENSSRSSSMSSHHSMPVLLASEISTDSDSTVQTESLSVISEATCGSQRNSSSSARSKELWRRAFPRTSHWQRFKSKYRHVREKMDDKMARWSASYMILHL